MCFSKTAGIRHIIWRIGTFLGDMVTIWYALSTTGITGSP